MIDSFSILLAHGLLLIACWRLLSRPDLDDERTARPEPSTPQDAAGDA